MARQWTQAETAVFPQIDEALQERGLDMYGENSNGPTLVQYFEANPSIPALLPQFHAAVSVLRDKLVWRSPAWKEYDQLSRSNPAKAAAVVRWLLGGAKTQGVPNGLVSDVENAVALLKELATWYGGRDYQVTTDALWQAIHRIQSSGRVVLHFVSDKKVDTTNHKMGVMFDKGEVNRSFVDAVKQSRPPEHKSVAPTPEQASEAEAEAQARAISRDGTWADREELTAVLNRERNRGATWAETVAVMKRIQKERHGFRAQVA
jgi:Zn-finger nucleic acid-binding protein